jgi:hypothetical protein
VAKPVEAGDVGVHDLGHLAQVARVMAKQYREGVGPRREYLPVLDRR